MKTNKETDKMRQKGTDSKPNGSDLIRKREATRAELPFPCLGSKGDERLPPLVK